MAELERITGVPVRDVWRDEARDFTPWLGANADLLGEALGLDLELVETEVAVGSFSADAHFRVTTSGDNVVVENMLAPSDHDHVGKLLTYAAGIDAPYAVLVAERIKPEHASALAWLNTNSRDGISFFGIEIEAWQIGDSGPAPHLNVVVKPDQWQRSVQPRTAPRTALQETYYEWWDYFLPRLRDAIPGWTNSRAPSTANWYSFPAGRSGLSYSVVFAWPGGSADYQLRVELYMKLGDAAATAAMYGHLHERRGEIEATFGGQLDWQPNDYLMSSKVLTTYERGTDPNERERWDEYAEWTLATLGRFRSALQPHVLSFSARTGS